MRKPSIGSSASALLLLVTVAQAHKGVHEHLEAIHKRHRESRARTINETYEKEDTIELVKRGGQCAFPYDAGLVAVTPGSANAGWAMSPDQPCKPGSYCPYACPSGQVSMQWDPKATSYSYPQSMNGGLYCDQNGQISKPFPDKPYCQQTATNIGVVNNAGGTVAFCQTVLPGNEAMLIPTSVDGYANLAVPGTDYWAGTAAHYYINPPGTSAAEACVWGTNSNPWGNWSPYVAGANVDSSGQTFIKLGWNPIYLEPTTPFRNKMPDWGVKIDCPNGGCNGLPCQIDPTANKVNEMKGSASDGAGGGAFCVVTVPKGVTANFVVFGSGGADAKGGQFYQSSSAAPSSTTTSSTTTSAEPSTTSSTTTIESSSTWNSTTSEEDSTSTWATTNTTSSRTGPTGQPYYSLFNTSVPEATAAATPDSTSPTDASVTEGVKIASATGGAPSVSWSMTALAPLAFWCLFL